MIRILVNGANGYMGRILCDLIEKSDKFELAGKVDISGDGVMRSLDEFEGQTDMVIDFSFHTSAPGVIDWAIRNNTAAMIATTGHTEEEKKLIIDASERIPVFYSATMSIGVAMLANMAKKAAALFPEADIEIVESHHNRKVDAPSGTALLLAEKIKEARPGAGIVTGRSGMSKRQANEIGIASLRLGNLAGTHEVIINTGNQQISLKHETFDRSMFAEGALSAAEFLYGKKAGLYNMYSIFTD